MSKNDKFILQEEDIVIVKQVEGPRSMLTADVLDDARRRVAAGEDAETVAMELAILEMTLLESDLDYDENGPEPQDDFLVSAAAHPRQKDIDRVLNVVDEQTPAILAAVKLAFAAGRRTIDRVGLRVAKTPQEVMSLVDGAGDAVEETFRKVLTGTLLRAMDAGGQIAIRGAHRSAQLRVAKRGEPSSGLKFKFNVRNKRAARWARKHALDLATDLAKTTRDDLRRAVERVFTDPTMTQEDLYNEVLDAVGDEVRASTIARTESMMAVSAGQREGWAQAIEEGLLPDDSRRTWIATPIGACELCIELDGAVADVNGKYPSPGDEGPPMHPNCRCTEGII